MYADNYWCRFIAENKKSPVLERESEPNSLLMPMLLVSKHYKRRLMSLILTAKRVKPRCFQERVGHFEPRFQGEGVVPGEYFWFLQN